MKILVIKLGALGDFILTSDKFKAIKDKYPNAHITLMTGDSFVKIAKQSGFFNDYIIDNRTEKLSDILRICKNIAFSKYDLIFDLQVSKRTKYRYFPFSKFLTPYEFKWINYGKTLFFSPSKWIFTFKKSKVSKFYLGKLSQPDISFLNGDGKFFNELPKKYVLLISGCSPNHPYKRWAAENYAKLAQKLAKKKMYTVVLGTSAEQNEIELICKDNKYAVNFCNKSSLLDIPNIAKKAVMVIGNDTGPTHMCACSGAKVITLFGKKTARSALKFSNVKNIIRKDINNISVDDVFKLMKF